MAKSIFEEMGGTYHEDNGYLIPDLTLPPEEEKPIGINSYFADINEQAEELFFRLVKQFAEKEGITEELKSTDQLSWIGVMNNIRARVREIVYTDIVYA